MAKYKAKVGMREDECILCGKVTDSWLVLKAPDRDSAAWDWEWQQLEDNCPRATIAPLPPKAVCPECSSKTAELNEYQRNMRYRAWMAIKGDKSQQEAVGKRPGRPVKFKPDKPPRKPAIHVMRDLDRCLLLGLRQVASLLATDAPGTAVEHTASEWYSLLRELVESSDESQDLSWGEDGPRSPATLTHTLKSTAYKELLAKEGLVLTFNKVADPNNNCRTLTSITAKVMEKTP